FQDVLRAHSESVGREGVRGVHPKVPRRLAAIIDRAIDRTPGARFPTAAALEKALRSFLFAPRLYAILAPSAAAIALTRAAAWMGEGETLGGRGTTTQVVQGMTMRPIDWPFNWLFLGAPSLDGRWLTYTDRRSGNVGVLNLRNGSTRLITDDGNFDKGHYA